MALNLMHLPIAIYSHLGHGYITRLSCSFHLPKGSDSTGERIKCERRKPTNFLPIVNQIVHQIINTPLGYSTFRTKDKAKKTGKSDMTR